MADKELIIVPVPKPVRKMTDEERRDFARHAVRMIKKGLSGKAQA